jgi:hypothetical protein
MMLGVSIVLQAGCVTGHRTLDLPATPTAAVPADTRSLVYVASVTDARTFENNPSDPSVPSVDGDVTKISAYAYSTALAEFTANFSHEIDKIGLRGISQATATLPAQH